METIIQLWTVGKSSVAPNDNGLCKGHNLGSQSMGVMAQLIHEADIQIRQWNILEKVQAYQKQ